LIRRLQREESGYSLVEVLASIILLTLAILPMVGMFDMGLNGAIRGSNYDKARALAQKQLEQAQSLSYATVRTEFPNAPCTFDDNSGLCAAEDLEDPDGEFDRFRYTVRKQYVEPNDTGGFDNSEDGSDTGMMQITVDVGWDGDFDWDDDGYDPGYTATTIKVR
jgi:Tfp pilus assembly protein PilV